MAKTNYNAEYFEGLGFEPEATEKLAKNWRPRPPQTENEVRDGVLQEREAREASANATWAKELGTKK